MSVLEEDKIKECKVVFDLFDEDHDGHLDKEKLGDIMRVLGAAPTKEDLEKYKKNIKGNSFDYNTFMIYFKDKIMTQDSEEDLINEFKKLDKNGNGFITKDDLVDLMKNYENALTNEEIEEIISISNPDSQGNIDYQRLAEVLLGK